MGKRKRSSRVDGPLYLPRYWLSWLVLALSWLLSKLPDSLQRGLSRTLARLLIKMGSSRSKVIRRNIELCFPEMPQQQQLDLVGKSLASTIQVIFDLMNLTWGPTEAAYQRGEVIGQEHLEAALGTGKPLIFLTGHFNAFFLAFARLAQLVPYHLVYRKVDNPVFEAQLYQRGMRRNAMNAIPRKNIIRILRQLKGQGAVLIEPDQDFGSKGSVFIPFFGIQTATTTSIPRYAAIAGANVLTLDIYRKEGGDYALNIGPVLENFPSGDDLADTRRWSDWLEQTIRRHPEDYFWLHKRFKTRPPGEEKIY